LSIPLRDIEGLAGYVQLRAFLRFHGRPLGYVSLSVSGDRCRARELLATTIVEQKIKLPLVEPGKIPAIGSTPEGWIIKGLQTIQAVERKSATPLPLVTVAVCTRDRAEDLAFCLEAIKRLAYANLEVLVIDNAPKNDASRELVKKRFPGFHYKAEPRPGLDWARNRAIHEAKGEIIAFTDDDVIVDPDWVHRLARIFTTEPDVMAVTGLVAPSELETEAQILFENYGGFGRGFKRKTLPLDQEKGRRRYTHLEAGGLGTGANMAFRKSVFEKIGSFDPALDVGTVTQGGGDLEMYFRVVQEGYTLVYEPDVIVRHKHRRSSDELKVQIRSWGIAFVAYLVRSAMEYPGARLVILGYTFRWFLGRHALRLLENCFTRDRLPFDLLLAELTGSFIGLTAYHRARRAANRIRTAFGPIDS